MLRSLRSQIWRVALLAIPLLAGPIGAFAENVLFEFFGTGDASGDLPDNKIILSRSTPAITELIRVDWPLSHDPMQLEIALDGGRIQLWINGVSVFDVVDPNPLPFGGIGVHTVWEAAARFDDIVVTSLGGG